MAEAPSITTPITSARFASALEDLPLSALHSKAAELRNSIFHLRHSNAQLQPFADSGDRDCIEAIGENEAVMARFRERVDLLKVEVVIKRQMPWVEWDEDGAMGGEDAKVNGVNGTNGDTNSRVNGDMAHVVGETRTAQSGQTGGSGSLSDEELRRRLAQQMDDDEEEDGLHL